MKRTVIDENVCQGARECARSAVQAVEFSDDGIAHAPDVVLDNDVATRLEATCPSIAITALNG